MLRRWRQGGFSLIELMVAMSTALFLLSGLIYLFTNFTRANTDMLKMTRLQQELRGIMTMMINDIRRAGYWSQAATAWEVDMPNAFAPIRVVGGNCILYSYDKGQDDMDGLPDSDDYAGFKLDGTRIRIRTSATPCHNTSCSNCSSGVWWTLNDENVVDITQLRFRQASSRIPAMHGGIELGFRRIEIVLGGSLVESPHVKYILHESVFIPNATIIPPSS